MKYQITTTLAENEWEQTMVCEFANATIAELVLADTETYAYEKRRYIPAPSSDKAAAARLQHEGTTVTLTCNKGHSWCRYWHGDPEANKLELEALAKEWEAKEQTYLPIMRYFEVGAREYNDRFSKWANERNKELTDLEYQIKELERKLSACQSLLESTRDQQGETNRDILDCLKIDNDQIKGLWRALYLHRERLFHFLDRGK